MASLLAGAPDPARRLRSAQARDPAPHADAAAHGRRPGLLAAAGLGRRRRARRPRRLPRGLVGCTIGVDASQSCSPLRYRRAVIEATTSEAGPRLDRDFTISLWAEVPEDRAGAAGGLAAKFDPVIAHGLQPQRDLERRRLQRAGRRAAHLVRDRRRQRAALVRPRAAVADLELRQQLADRLRGRRSSRRPRTRPSEADRGHVYRHVGETAWEDLGQVGHGGRARRRPADRPPRRALRGDLELRLDARPRPGSRAVPRLPLRRPRPLGGLRAARALAADLQPRLVPRRPAARSATTRPSTSIAAEPRGSRWRRSTRSRTRRPSTTGGSCSGCSSPRPCARSTAAAGATSAIRIGDPERCDEIHSLVTFRGALHAGTWPLGRVARWDAAARRWQQAGRLGDSTEVMALNVYNGKLYGADDPARRGLPLRARRLVDEPAPAVRAARLATRAGAEHARPPDGDRRMREWTRVTSLTQHDGLAVRVGRELHERRRRRAGGRPRNGARASRRASSRRRRARSSRAATTSPPCAAAATLAVYVDGARGGDARGARSRIGRDGRAAARSARTRPAASPARSTASGPSTARSSRARSSALATDAAAHPTRRRQRDEATGESGWSATGGPPARTSVRSS